MLNILSIFSGAGGLDYSFESTGLFSVRLMVEMQAEFCTTLRMNQHNGYLEDATILEVDATEVRPLSALGSEFGMRKPDGIIGGPPCESFTAIGKHLV